MHVVVAIPTYSGSVEAECLESIFRLQDHILRTRRNIQISLSWISGLTVDAARNALVAKFLSDASATHLFFVDADMGFEPSLFDSLIDENRPLVAAFCPSKNLQASKVAEAAISGVQPEQAMAIAARYVAADRIVHRNGTFDPTPSGFVEVSAIGTGIMLIHRSVFDAIGRHFPELRTAPDRRHRLAGPAQPILDAFAPLRGQDGRWLSEDLSFCQRWRETGGDIWANVDQRITHVGRQAVTGRFRDQLDHYGGLPR
ncbi:hypothetical protein SAMN05428997_1036 [Bosea sp. CRIB-10]|uniref:hypothetical protein n=1 Tax=Bosea sp. CRIB-10 TaxID=378404 RepID=UPI0008EE9503|nr:hypothetical protein [Bosea sp. CRIB-10]SFB92373.1 hypothetical protein SAMN05428997_1036 [Bosea sp. CRIB-10]